MEQYLSENANDCNFLLASFFSPSLSLFLKVDWPEKLYCQLELFIIEYIFSKVV